LLTGVKPASAGASFHESTRRWRVGCSCSCFCHLVELALFVQRRLAAGETQAEIARRLGKSRQYVTYATALIGRVLLDAAPAAPGYVFVDPSDGGPRRAAAIERLAQLRHEALAGIGGRCHRQGMRPAGTICARRIPSRKTARHAHAERPPRRQSRRRRSPEIRTRLRFGRAAAHVPDATGRVRSGRGLRSLSVTAARSAAGRSPRQQPRPCEARRPLLANGLGARDLT
jgi:hypothetical protein